MILTGFIDELDKAGIATGNVMGAIKTKLQHELPKKPIEKLFNTGFEILEIPASRLRRSVPEYIKSPLKSKV